ncbi:MAG: alpha/beta hydrolase [Arthrobacter sp.]|jgi:alpha-beta hydrolase superfamily lysophospholipase|nr:alpha/beta hydrolase [Arthrobacter sp.]
MSIPDGWEPDVLGPEFAARQLPLGRDAEGELGATLIRYLGERAGTGSAPSPAAPWAGADVLYVHGWSDYFFQAELARSISALGARFFALDLRKYGRSLREGQTPGYIEDLAGYDDEIGAALRLMRAEHSGRKLVLLGHSTGGLTLSLWAHRHPGRADAIVLNSPWLELQASSAGRHAIAPLIEAGARVDPRATLPNVDFGFYTRAVSAHFDGEWEYNEAWRPERGFPVRPGWLRAVLAGHAAVAGRLSIDAPILTLLSARSTFATRWMPEMERSDSVLVVDEIAERATRLGRSVTIERLDGALHDVFLSAAPVRALAYETLARWAAGHPL